MDNLDWQTRETRHTDRRDYLTSYFSCAISSSQLNKKNRALAVMNIFAFVGHSGTGKTRLLSQLIPELKSRGNTVAVVKRTAHGFTLGPEGKDSRQYLDAGADCVSLVSQDQLAVLMRNTDKIPFNIMASEYLNGYDIILIEGGKTVCRK